jgi:hypothetical protein
VLLLEQQRRGKPGGRQLHAQPRLEHRLPAGQRLLPERRVEGLMVVVGVPAPGVGHQQVEPARFLAYARKQGLHLPIVGVIGPDGDPESTAGADFRGRLGDGGASRHVDGGAGVTERERDASADSARRAGDDRHRSIQPWRGPEHRSNRTGRQARS